MTVFSRDAGRELLISLFRVALARVHGRRCVARYLRDNRMTGDIAAIAIGKAASAMLEGAIEVLQDELSAGLVISPAGQSYHRLNADSRITRVCGNHPVPGTASLLAGEQLLDFISTVPANCQLLFLVSGGSSSLVEVPKDGVSLSALQRANQWMLGSGLDIVQMNRVRTALSQIKGGQLRAHLGGRQARVLLLSDVPGDDVSAIGSGLLYPAPAPAAYPPELPDWLCGLLERLPVSATTGSTVEHCIIGDNRTALEAVVAQAGQQGVPVELMREPLAGDVHAMADRVVNHMQTASTGLYAWGGETTVRLPDNPGQGGRNQQLALAVAIALADDETVVLLAAGTDGQDGSSDAAGAVIDAQTLRRGKDEGLDAQHCLQRAAAGEFLQASGDLLQTGPTGTNVMDIVIALKLAEVIH